MKTKAIRLLMTAVMVVLLYTFIAPADVSAKVYLLPDGTQFDSDFYANTYPEMKAAYADGKYPERLLWHYLTYGIKEGRLPSLYSTYNPSPAIMSNPYIYPAGNYCVVPYKTLYPYTPYAVATPVATKTCVYPYVTNSYTMIPCNPNPYAYMCIPYVY